MRKSDMSITGNLDHGHDRHDSNSCCGDTSATVGQSSALPSAADRSFRVNGLDCADEVAILNRVVGPEVGGSENLLFDVLNGRMTVLDTAEALSAARLLRFTGSTGISAKPVV